MTEEQKDFLEEEARALGVRLARAQDRRHAAENAVEEARRAAERSQVALRRAEEDLKDVQAEEQRALDELQAAVKRHTLSEGE
jgi:hypothetical protein